MKFFKQLVKIIDGVNKRVGNLVSFFAIAMMLSVVYEVVARYFFKSPTIWSMEINQQLLCGYTALAGGYTLLHEDHVNVDVVYERFSPKSRAFIDVFTSVFAFLFISILIVMSWDIAVEAWEDSERSLNLLFEIPLFPVKVCIPIGAVLFGLQLIAKLIRDIEKLIAIYKTDANASPGGGQ